MSFTGRKGALPATAESIIASIRSVFARILTAFNRIWKIGLTRCD